MNTKMKELTRAEEQVMQEELAEQEQEASRGGFLGGDGSDVSSNCLRRAVY